jgi:hypothetical protein
MPRTRSVDGISRQDNFNSAKSTDSTAPKQRAQVQFLLIDPAAVRGMSREIASALGRAS